MVYSKSERKYRALLSKKIRAICARYGMTLYGSFFSGNFHLNVDANQTFSDLDLICNRRVSEDISKKIESEILETTGLIINVSIRSNRNHIDSLPKSVSRYLATVDTTLAFYKKRRVTDEYFSYLISKFLLRTAYADIYYENNLVSSMKSSNVLKNDPAFVALVRNKLQGRCLSKECMDSILSSRLVCEEEIIYGLTTFCQTRSVSDMHLHWVRFMEEANEHQLTELANDISKKIQDVSENPNRAFCIDSGTRRSLSLTLGLATE